MSTSTRPQLQIALDNFDLVTAYQALQPAATFVDIIEVGTVLCLAEGMRAVREIRALFPKHRILADVRIAEAGGIISRLAFESGANLVSVVSGASLTTVQQVCETAAAYHGEVQVELGEETDLELARQWRAAGVGHVIVHRSRDSEATGALHWSAADVEQVTTFAELGFTVTITGGVKATELERFAGQPVGIVIAGRSIVQAADPAAAAAQFRQAIQRVWP